MKALSEGGPARIAGKHKAAADKVSLPSLDYKWTPNVSDRQLARGHHPHLIVIHRPVGGYVGSIRHLMDPHSDASAHVITEGNSTGVDVATQLVPWDKKAWSCMAFNSVSYNIEVDDDAWNGRDPEALLTAQRIVGFLCHKTGIPPHISIDPMNRAGIISHYLLGRVGGGHTDPTTDLAALRRFAKGCAYQVERGHYRKTWGRGRLYHI